VQFRVCKVLQHCGKGENWDVPKRHRHTGRIAALSFGSFGPPRTLANAAGLLDRAQISTAQTVIRDRVLACGLEAMLRDGSTDLLALTA
jgi:hypothetical protein